MLKRLLLSSFTAIGLSACHHDTKLAFEDVPTDTISLVQDKLNDIKGDTTDLAFPMTGAGTTQKDTWMALFKGCYESNVFGKDFINSDLLYLGPSSNMYLGTIVDKKFFNNDFDVKTELKYLIPATDFTKFASVGNGVNNCDMTKQRDINFSLDAILDGVISQGMNDSIGLGISRWDSLKVLSGKWQIDYIKEADLIRYLKMNSSNPDVAYYKDQVFKKHNRIITKVVKVTGFTAEAYYKNGLSAGVSAALNNPVTVDVVNNNKEEAKSNELTAKVTFAKTTKGDVRISSQNSFYVFGKIRAGKQLD